MEKNEERTILSANPQHDSKILTIEIEEKTEEKARETTGELPNQAKNALKGDKT
ncbi:hypothetical protein H7U35_09675 [Mediterranea massiliensis]|uniref:Uncharacterized protein n=1 Tax=Mediterranea massiliensis TaxID=1841865 RepID=A0ABS2E1J7_9BACT|nr:hypothetical protein [Mediterranea massiliensis]MBM6735484.1 hypothetical protein [Mediterranea massiliensis]